MANKIIVITGAGVGLGRALARRFVADGEQVVLLGRTEAKVRKVATDLGERAMAVRCDVADPESVRAAFAAIAARHPPGTGAQYPGAACTITSRRLAFSSIG